MVDIKKLNKTEGIVKMIFSLCSKEFKAQINEEILYNMSITLEQGKMRIWVHFNGDIRAEYIDTNDFVLLYHWTKEKGWYPIKKYISREQCMKFQGE